MKLSNFKLVNHNKKLNKKRLSFTMFKKKDKIEVLELEDKKKINKLKISGMIVASLACLILVISLITGKNIVVLEAKKILYNLGVYTEEIEMVEIESDDSYDDGYWYIDKSAIWIGPGKAQITFDVNSFMKINDHNKDIVLVFDKSSSMEGEKFTEAINDAKYLVEDVLYDDQNRVAIVTLDGSSEILSSFSNDIADLLNKLDSLVSGGDVNYNAALQNVDAVMNGYTKQSNRDVVVVFLTGGYPNKDTPNQVGSFQVLKEKYPYMKFNGIQYEMGNDIINEIKQITDNQFIADQSTIYDILYYAAVEPYTYENFIVTDYIDDNYFTIDSVDDIKVTKGQTSLNGNKVTWDLGTNSYMTATNEKMTINITLRQEYMEIADFYPTNKSESIDYKLEGDSSKTVNSSLTPVLKNSYKVVYDTNIPEGCTLPDIASEMHSAYQNVEKKTIDLSCDGYSFKGWDIVDDYDIQKISDEVFVMPNRDVTIRATWAKQDIKKSMNGKVAEKQSLYNILRDAANRGTLARTYTGQHQDSMAGVGNKKIYHWYATNDTQGTQIQNKNNVIFGGHCWQMLRTTDTGGVKMIYNGEPEDGKCLNTRGNHVGYSPINSAQALYSSYWYGTDYIYDNVSKTFKLSGTTEKETWSEITGPQLVGKYTCKATNVDDTCSTLYLGESYYNPVGAYLISLNSSSDYSQFGTSYFNRNYNSPAGVGYMYNTEYPYNSKQMKSTESLLLTTTPSTTFWYADSISYDSSTGNYSLNDPYKVSSLNDLVGKYTFMSTINIDNNTSVYYISKTKGSDMYYIKLVEGHDLDYYRDIYTYGDSFTYNGDGTYTINNPRTFSRLNWYSYYSEVNNKYVCKNATNNICSDIWYITGTTNTNITYESNYKYSAGFSWDGSKYILDNDNSISFFEWNQTNQRKLNDFHYTCWNSTGECTTISYIYSLGSNPYYINIADGKSVDTALNEMLYNDDVNSIDSSIKVGLDAWYKHYLLGYSDYLEDTIFCNDRTISTNGGWNPNGGSMQTPLYFNEYNVTSDLSCTNVNDKFSVSNNKAKLTYKVGLISTPEMKIINNYNALKTGKTYSLLSPYSYSDYMALGSYIHLNGQLSSGSVGSNLWGVRPAISLIPGIEYSDGDGSMESPYVVDMS